MMIRVGFGRSVLGVGLAGVLLAGCGGAQMTEVAPQSTMAQSRAHRASGSWMLPEAKGERLLYVSDANNGTVTVYTDPKGRLVGTLTGFGLPWGLCSDKAGNVFVTDYRNDQIVEYRHGGSNPINTLQDGDYFPVDCSVDPITGDLAVANISSEGSLGYPPGAISIYAKAQGEPKFYPFLEDSNYLNFLACTYDDMGDLFADAFGYSGPDFQMVELPRHHKKLIGLKIRPGLSSSAYPGGLQWDGKYLDLGTANIVHQYSISKRGAKEVGSTELSGQGVGLGLFWVGKFADGSDPQATQLVTQGSDEVQYYNYPAGGMPTRLITNGLDGPLGVTVSRAHR
jgi:DNA-binding beta-propeller fold protein YncE